MVADLGALAANWSRSPSSLTVSVIAGMLVWAIVNVDHLRRTPPWDTGWVEQVAALEKPGTHRVFVAESRRWSFEVETFPDGSMRGVSSPYWSRTRKPVVVDPRDGLLRGTGNLEDGQIKRNDHTADQGAEDHHDEGF